MGVGFLGLKLNHNKFDFSLQKVSLPTLETLPYTEIMLRLLVSSFLAATAIVAIAQDWAPQGQIDSRNVQIERREGNVVKGTEFVHFEYKVSLRVLPNSPQSAFTVWCDAVCKGKKHKEHSECDMSCDERCTLKHPVKLQGRAVKLRSNMDSMTATSAAKARGIGMPGGPGNWSSATSNALQALEAAAKADKLEFDAGHLEEPCTLTDRYYGYDVKNVQVKGEFWKVGYYQTGGVRTPINEMVDSHEGIVMAIYKTRRDPILPIDKTIACKCKFEAPPPPAENRTGRIPTFSGLGWRKPDGTVCIPDDKKIKVTATGDGLTITEIRVNNETGEAYEVIIYSGTKLIPDNSGTQIMTCMGEQRAQIAATGTTVLQVAVDPEPNRYGETTFKLRVACTEMNKQQPSPKTTFKIVPPNDPVLSRICSIEDTGFMRSALGQGRVWIYTDVATREQINKHLLPGLTDGMYLNALHGLHRAGVDVTVPRYRPLLDPTLLAASTASKDATFWYADLLRTLDPKMGYSKRVLDAMKKTLAEKAEAIDARHAAYVALALSESDDKQTRMAVLEMMEKSVPAAHRVEFLKEGGLGVLLSVATFGDDAEALRAFEVAKLYAGPEVKAMLLGFANWGRESIRAGAEAAASGM